MSWLEILLEVSGSDALLETGRPVERAAVASVVQRK